MTEPIAPLPAARPGLRQLKRQRTRAAIQTEAMRLFSEQGYEATTCDQIAAAAEVSPATFFRYFPTKEDVVLADEYDDLLISLLRRRPADEAPLEALRRALSASFDAVYAADEDVIRKRVHFVFSVPALRARQFEQHRAMGALLAEELGPRMGADPGGLAVRAVAGALVGAVVAALDVWAAGGGSLPHLVDEALAALQRGVAPAPSAAAIRRRRGTL